jgi:hypothetical protein
VRRSDCVHQPHPINSLCDHSAYADDLMDRQSWELLTQEFSDLCFARQFSLATVNTSDRLKAWDGFQVKHDDVVAHEFLPQKPAIAEISLVEEYNESSLRRNRGPRKRTVEMATMIRKLENLVRGRTFAT